MPDAEALNVELRRVMEQRERTTRASRKSNAAIRLRASCVRLTLRHRSLVPSSRLRHIPAMSGGGHPDSPSRAFAFALALLAITLNFLQPLVHAAAMRDGGPRSLWSALCNASTADPDQAGRQDGGGRSADTVAHECCLGLAHAQVGPAASLAFVVLAPVAAAVVALHDLEQSANLGIRDGPNQPRAPPLSFA